MVVMVERWGQPHIPQALRNCWRRLVQASGRAVGWGEAPSGHWDPTALVFQGDCPSDPSHKTNPVLLSWSAPKVNRKPG